MSSIDTGPSNKNASSYVQSSGTTSGLTINVHPLPILNISDHYNRARLTTPPPAKLIGALLGTQSNREVSIVNSFELAFVVPDVAGDDAMGESGAVATQPFKTVDSEFLATRKEQFKQVFPTLDVVGWYTIGDNPTADDVALHQQFVTSVDTPILLLFDTEASPDSQDLPIKVYEAALAEEGVNEGRFIELEYGIETGEAERIAVDGVSKGGNSGDGEESALVGNLTTQRNAILMLYERIKVLLHYVSAVMNKTAKPDHAILRQISALVATLPTMTAEQFQEELMTEYTDVQLTAYITNITKQLNALAEYTDKHNMLYPAVGEEFAASGGIGGSGVGGRSGGKAFNMGSFGDFGSGKRRG